MSISIDNSDNLIKNFYIFGIEPKDINISEIQTNFSKKDILPIKLLSKFPPIESENYPIIESNMIISHCFPNGLFLKSSDKTNNGCEFFHFSLKNFYQISSNDKTLYFTCCIFYENLTEYIKIKNKQKNENNKINNTNLYLPKLICINSYYQYPNEFRIILEKLISYSKSKEIKIPIEKIIENIVLGIPAPKKLIFYPSLTKGIFSDSRIDFSLTDINKVRIYSYKMQLIYTFETEDILEIYKWILLEQPILFFSEDKELMTNIFETFLLLLFPFKYQGPHCSILPESNVGIIEQEEYFIFGINEKWENNINDNKINYFEKYNLNVFKTVLICDIDNKKIIHFRQHKNLILTHNDFHKNPNYNIQIISTPENNSNPISKGEKYKLPQKYSERLKNRLEKNSKSKKNKEYSKEINQKISEDFFYFLVSILKDYNQYLFNTENDIIIINDLFLKENIKTINIDKLFMSNQFIKKGIEKNDDPYFFLSFFKTNLFKNFLYRKYQNLEKDKFDFLLFDETIVMKKNKNEIIKVKTKFLDSKNLSTKNNYLCDKEAEFNNNELEIINEKKDKLINYYQQYDGKKFSYYIFPRLLNDNEFLDVKKEYNNQFNEDQLAEFFSHYENNPKEIDDKEFFKIYEGGLINRYNFDKNQFVVKNEMRNNVGYLWLSIFCFTFYYCDDIDKEYRFQELSNNLKKMENILISQRKIIYYVFMTLIKYGNDSMVIKFYDYLNNSNCNNYDLYNIFCNRMLLNGLEKEKIKENLILKQTFVGNTEIAFNYYKDKTQDELEIKNSLNKSEKDKRNNTNFISKRTFHLIGNNKKKANKENINNNSNKEKEQIEEIEFGSVKCPFCNEELNFAKLLETNTSKRREIPCSNCKKLFVPKCMVRISTFMTSFKIFHPYYLFNEIAMNIIKKFGTKIDLDILKDEYSDFYWSCILYFSFCGYSFDMLIKYKKGS